MRRVDRSWLFQTGTERHSEAAQECTQNNKSGQARYGVVFTSGMWQCGLEVGNPCKKDRLSLVIDVRLEHILVPVVRAQAIFQQLMQTITIIFAVILDKCSLQELRPVILR